MPIYVDYNKTNLWRSTFVIPIRYTQNKFYDDLLLLFCDAIFIFVINFRAKSSSLGTYDENGDFITDDIPFCDKSERRHEQIVTDYNISSSERSYMGVSSMKLDLIVNIARSPVITQGSAQHLLVLGPPCLPTTSPCTMTTTSCWWRRTMAKWQSSSLGPNQKSST
jgi:hypothetical protein